MFVQCLYGDNKHNFSGITKSPETFISRLFVWSWQEDLNPQPADYKSAALPIELCQHIFPIGDPEGTRTLDLQRDRLAF